MMNKILVVFLLGMTTLAIGQEGVDPRLLAAHGDKIVTLYETNREAYDNILYRLDNSFYITQKDKYNGNASTYLSINNVKAIGDQTPAFTLDLLKDLKSFNYALYDFRFSQTQKTVYDLGDGRLMIFYSLDQVKENYSRGVNNNNDEKNN